MTPGSPYAIEHGCTCPVLDNSHGQGYLGGNAKCKDGSAIFWINENCPIHAADEPGILAAGALADAGLLQPRPDQGATEERDRP